MEKEYILPEEAIYSLLENTKGEDRKKLEEVLLNHLSKEEKTDYQDILSGKKMPSLMSDVIAKKIFDPDEHPERLEYLFQEITGDNTIKIQNSIKNEGFMVSANSKKMIFDLNSLTTDGRLADLEFQVSAQDFFLRRGELYGSDLLLIQYSVGNREKKNNLDYNNAKGVILIFLLKHSPKELKDFPSDRYIHRFSVQTADSGLSYIPMVQTIYVQLDKSLEQYKINVDGENNKKLQLFLSFLMDSNEPSVLTEAGKDEMLSGILEEAKQLVQDKGVQTMILAEKYAAADLNAIKSYERNKGVSSGETKMAKLMSALCSLGRYADIEKAATDENARKAFYKEFNIID